MYFLLQCIHDIFSGSFVFMPKLKNSSAVKKRFKLSATGKLISAQAGKNHFMRRRTKSQLRNLRGTSVLEGQQVKNTVKFFMPYN